MKEKDFNGFEQLIGIEFKDKDLLKQAFTHRSFLNEHKALKGKHNERLEFLGDAVVYPKCFGKRDYLC
jgi:ribonuclease III